MTMVSGLELWDRVRKVPYRCRKTNALLFHSFQDNHMIVKEVFLHSFSYPVFFFFLVLILREIGKVGR